MTGPAVHANVHEKRQTRIPIDLPRLPTTWFDSQQENDGLVLPSRRAQKADNLGMVKVHLIYSPVLTGVSVT